MNFSHYLPDTPKRLRRFKRLIHGRPVALLVPGFSINELEDRIEELRDCDICYACVNKWLPLEEHILGKINKRLSILQCSADPDLFIEDICSYLEREDNNVYIGERLTFTAEGGQNLVRLYDNYDKKLLFFSTVPVPDFVQLSENQKNTWEDKPTNDFPLHFLQENSISILMALITIAEPRVIVLFGADGGRLSNDGLYYKRINEYIHPDNLPAEKSIDRDTFWFNRDFAGTLERTRNVHKVRKCEIINCSEKSYLTTLPKLSYNDTIEYLRRIC